MNILSYTLQLNDKMSSILDKVGASITKVNAGMTSLSLNLSLMNKMPAFSQSSGMAAAVSTMDTKVKSIGDNLTAVSKIPVANPMDRVGASIGKVNAGSLVLHHNLTKINRVPTTGLNRFGRASDHAFGKANRNVNGLTNRNRILGLSYDALQRRIREVENTIRTSSIPSQIRAARKELEMLQRRSNNQIGRTGGASASVSGKGGGGGLFGMIGGMKGMAAGAAIGLAMSIIPAATGFVSDSISKSLERQQIQTSFNVLAGGDAAGKTLTDQLVGLQKDTILGTEVFKNAQTMMGFGFDSTEVLDNLKMLGDVSMGDAGKLQSLTLAFSQIRAAGKLAGKDLLQLINAGFNPLDTMAQKTGKSIGVLKKEMEKGTISFAMVKQAFKDATGEGGRFENMLGKIAQTPAGKIQQLSGEWDELKVKMGAAFMPLVSMALNFASKMLPLVEKIIVPLTDGIQMAANFIQSASGSTNNWLTYLNTVKDIFKNSVVPYIKAVFDLTKGVVGELIDFVSKSEILKDVFRIMSVQVKLVFDLASNSMRMLKWSFENVVMPILKGIDKAYQLIKGSGKMQAISKNEIASPLIPGVTPPTTDPTGKGGSGSTTGKDTAKAIATGGTKTTHINITVGEMGNNMTVQSSSIDDGAEKIRDIILDQMARVFALAQGQM